MKKIDLYFAELYTETLKVQTSCTLISTYIVKIVPFSFLLGTVKRPAFKRDMHSIKLIRHECLNAKDLHEQGSACKGQKTILLTRTGVSHFVLCINKYLCKKEKQTLSYSCMGVYGLHQGSNKA